MSNFKDSDYSKKYLRWEKPEGWIFQDFIAHKVREYSLLWRDPYGLHLGTPLRFKKAMR